MGGLIGGTFDRFLYQVAAAPVFHTAESTRLLILSCFNCLHYVAAFSNEISFTDLSSVRNCAKQEKRLKFLPCSPFSLVSLVNWCGNDACN